MQARTRHSSYDCRHYNRFHITDGSSQFYKGEEIERVRLADGKIAFLVFDRQIGTYACLGYDLPKEELL